MLSQKIVELNLATRRIARKDGNGKALNQRTRLLYLLLKGDRSPKTLIPDLAVAKPNLTILARNMIDEGLIEKLPYSSDKRAVLYHITEAGKLALEDSCKELEEEFLSAFTASEIAELEQKLDDVINLLSFVI